MTEANVADDDVYTVRRDMIDQDKIIERATGQNAEQRRAELDRRIDALVAREGYRVRPGPIPELDPVLDEAAPEQPKYRAVMVSRFGAPSGRR